MLQANLLYVLEGICDLPRIKEYFDVIKAVCAALAAIGTAFMTWVWLPLSLRLVLIAAIGMYIFWTIAARFLPKITKASVGFETTSARPAIPSNKRWVLAVIVYFLGSCALAALAWLSTERLAVIATAEQNGEGIYLKLEAAYVESNVVVRLKSSCEYVEQSAQVVRVNEGRPNEELQIFHFRGSQAVEVSCLEGRLFDARDIRIVNGSAILMFSLERSILRIAIVIGGFILCVFGLLRLRAL